MAVNVVNTYIASAGPRRAVWQRRERVSAQRLAAPGKRGRSPAPRARVPPSCTTAYMTQSILPQHANTLNITFGGQVMSWVEQCAYISASRLRAPAMLTAAMDSVTFVRPTRVGDILYITAQGQKNKISVGTVALNGSFGDAEIVAGGTSRVFLSGNTSGQVAVNVDGISTTWVQGSDSE
ncbi:Acyl-coenzyme A thioesterase 12, partial [Tetrabaena socialis]